MSAAPRFPGCIGTEGCASLCSPMNVQPKADMTTRLRSWHIVAANRRGYTGPVAFMGA
jgi:hypothetical protein